MIITHIYSLSENYEIAWYDSETESIQLFPWWLSLLEDLFRESDTFYDWHVRAMWEVH